MDKGDEKNNLTRTWSRDPMLAWSSPISSILALDQTITDNSYRCFTTDSLPWGYLGQYVRASAYVELDG